MPLAMQTDKKEQDDVSLDCESQQTMFDPVTSSLETEAEEKEALVKDTVRDTTGIRLSASSVVYEIGDEHGTRTALLDCESQLVAEPSTQVVKSVTGGDQEGHLSAKSNVSNCPEGSESRCLLPKQRTKMTASVLVLLALQNCSKTLLLRGVMKEKPTFLLSTAIIGVELLKLVLSCVYILVVERDSLQGVVVFIIRDYRNTLLLIVPAGAYAASMTLEYVALANIDAACFSVLVQLKLITTAIFSALLLRRRLRKIQLVSLIILTVGVMLVNTRSLSFAHHSEGAEEEAARLSSVKGITATLVIASSSGFASVYTEKIIKARRDQSVSLRGNSRNSLAFVQAQLALVSLVVMGTYALCKDYHEIRTKGFFHDFNGPAVLTVVNSAVGGLTVSAVLKFADSILKGYATSVSVILTGVLSVLLFGTRLDAQYYLGIVNVVCAIYIYSGQNLMEYAY